MNTPFDRTAPSNGVATSDEAAASLERPTLTALRQRVLAALAAAADGLTCEQVEEVTGLKHQTASARLYELATCEPPFAEFEYDQETGKPRRRRTRSGRFARIYFFSEVL